MARIASYSRRVTLMAEDLLVLLTDEETGRRIRIGRPYVIGAALLVDLALAGAVEVRRHRLVPPFRISVRPRDQELHPALEGAFLLIEESQRQTPRSLLIPLCRENGLEGDLAERGFIAPRSIMNKRQTRVVRVAWPAHDNHHRRELLRKLSGALDGSIPPDTRTALLISLLSAGRIASWVPVAGLSPREVRRAAGQIAGAQWPNDPSLSGEVVAMARLLARSASSAPFDWSGQSH